MGGRAFLKEDDITSDDSRRKEKYFRPARLSVVFI